jgi:hypothetical protein
MYVAGHLAARAELQRANVVANAIDELLKAPRFDAAALTYLVHRERYVLAVRRLRAELRVRRVGRKNPDPLPIFLDRHNYPLRPYRFGVEFGAITMSSETSSAVVTEKLEKLARGHGARAERARQVLAALGHIDWHSASRRVRAVALLSRICEAHLDGVP